MHQLPKKFVQRIQEILPQKEWDTFFEAATEPLPKTIRLDLKSLAPEIKNSRLKIEDSSFLAPLSHRDFRSFFY